MEREADSQFASSRFTTAERGRRPSRRSRQVCWLIVLVQSFLFVLATVVYQPFQEPDEPNHVDMVYAYRHGDWFLGPGERRMQLGIAAAAASVPNFALRDNLADSAPPTFGQRPSFNHISTSPSLDDLPNQMVQHPGLYYMLAAGYSYLIPGFEDLRYDIQVFLLRLLTVILLIPLPFLTYRTAMLLTGRPAVGYAAAVGMLLIPNFVRSGGSVSNDSLVILLGAVLMMLLAKVVTGDRSVRTAVLVGLAWGLGLLTKGTMLPLAATIGMVYLVGWLGALHRARRGPPAPFARSQVGPWIGSACLAGGVGLAIGGWWWIRNVVSYGTVQPAGYGPQFPPEVIYGPDRPGSSVGGFLRGIADLLPDRAWSALGLLDDPQLAGWLTVTLTLFSVVLVVAGTVIGFRRAALPRAAALALVTAPALISAFLLYKSYATYQDKLLFVGLQVRYLVPTWSVLFILGAVVLFRLLGARRNWLPMLTLIGVAVWTAAWVGFVLIDELAASGTNGFGALRSGLSYALTWAPWPKLVSLALAVIGVLAMVRLAAALRPRPSRQQPAISDPATAGASPRSTLPTDPS